MWIYCRLPIIQGGTTAFLIPTLVILQTQFPPCEEVVNEETTEDDRREIWQERMRLIQGTIAVSSLLQVLFGLTGKVKLDFDALGII